MKVYRYENAQGKGPYNSDWVWACELKQEHADYAHPSPYVEKWDGLSLRVPSVDHVYGCPTLTVLNQWFAGWHERLTEDGYSVVEYDVPAHNVRIASSGLQVAFIKP